MSVKNKLILASAALVFAGNASAIAIFDFENIADNETHLATLVSFTGSAAGDFTGERGATEMNFTSGGIGLTVTGTDTAGNATYNAYLDKGNAGLGVCKILSGDQCSPSSDDNVTPGEVLVLSFDRKVTITDTTFTNGSHGTSFLGSFDLTIDGVFDATYSLVHLFGMDLTGTVFELSNINTTATNPYQFYIETMDVTAVPVPAAAWLFGTGLLGLAGVARRKS